MSYKLIQTRSPFFVKYDTVNETVTLGLKVWTGHITGNKPSDDTYTLTKEASGGASTFEIAELIRDYISHTSVTSSGSVWVEAILNDGINAAETHTFLANEGYTLTTEGIQHADNQLLLDGVLLPLNDDGDARMLQHEGGNCLVPIYCNADTVNDWHYEIDGGSQVAILPATSSTTMVRYVNVPNGSGVLRMSLDGDITKVYFDELECNRYDKLSLLYVNKLGAKVKFPFNLKHTENISTKEETYKRSLVNYSTLGDYSGLHMEKKSIRETRQMMTLNTDWISEYYVKQIEELVLSEYVWLERPSPANNPSRYEPQPVNIKTSKHLKKNHLNDKLINYTLEIEAASEYINTIR